MFTFGRLGSWSQRLIQTNILLKQNDVLQSLVL